MEHLIPQVLYLKKLKVIHASQHPVVGASGAVFGLLLAYGMTFPNQVIYLNLSFL